MKVKVTEEKLYPVFKKFMETYFKKYEWRKNKYGFIWFVDPEGYGHLNLEKNKNLWVYGDIREKILRYIPMELSMLESLMSKWVEETLQVKGLNIFRITWLLKTPVGDTFQIEGLNTSKTLNMRKDYVGKTFPL
jgi:hypothetical protein